MKLVHCCWVGCYIWYNKEEPGRAAPPGPLLAIPNVTAHPINGQCTNHCIAVWWSVACGFNVAFKEIRQHGHVKAEERKVVKAEHDRFALEQAVI